MCLCVWDSVTLKNLTKLIKWNLTKCLYCHIRCNSSLYKTRVHFFVVFFFFFFFHFILKMFCTIAVFKISFLLSLCNLNWIKWQTSSQLIKNWIAFGICFFLSQIKLRKTILFLSISSIHQFQCNFNPFILFFRILSFELYLSFGI